MSNALVTDRTFLSLSIPLGSEFQAELEKSLMRDGCVDPIIAWNGVIIDGHKRYRICTAEAIDFTVTEMDFSSEDEAISWVCRQRIAEYQQQTAPYRYLVGCFYDAQKRIYHEAKKLPEEMRTVRLRPEWNRVSYYVGEELGHTHGTIEVYGAYAREMKQIAEKAWPLFEAILMETVTVTRMEIKDYATMERKEIIELCRNNWDMEIENERQPKMRVRMGRRESEPRADEIPLAVRVKEMPAYDPDMELRGLMLTIPTWITVINRVKRKTDQATEQGKAQLAQSLVKLEDEIDDLMEVIEHG